MPFILGRAVFWHAIKSGGTFVWRYMAAHGGARTGRGHDPVWYKDRLGLLEYPVHFGVIRNPWDWYASWFRHCASVHANSGGRVIREWSGCGADETPDFHNVVMAATSPSISVIPPLGIWDTDTSYPAPKPHEGLWSWYVRYHYFANGSRVNFLIPTDRLVEGLQEGLGWHLTESEARPHNTANTRTERGKVPEVTDYRSWYTPELVNRVAVMDGTMAARFGFRPFEKSDQAVFDIRPWNV